MTSKMCLEVASFMEWFRATHKWANQVSFDISLEYWITLDKLTNDTYGAIFPFAGASSSFGQVTFLLTCFAAICSDESLWAEFSFSVTSSLADDKEGLIRLILTRRSLDMLF